MIDLNIKDAALFIDMIERLIVLAQSMKPEAREMIEAQLRNEAWREVLETDASTDALVFTDAALAMLDALTLDFSSLRVVAQCNCEFDYDLEKHPDGDVMSCVHCGRELPAEEVRSP